MIDSVARNAARCIKVQGAARTGKTECLLRRVAALLDDGIAADGILVECTSGFAVQAFRRRLSALVGDEAAAGVRVTTAFDLCVELLSTDDAIAATGRTPRVLNNAEYKFFLEDMKTLGEPIRRLRGMLDFFYAQWSKLEPEKQWLMAGEEADVRDNMNRFLQLRDAMLKEEVAYVCANYLQSDAGADARQTYSHVLCDDFQNLDRALQTVLCLMADEQLIIAGNPNEAVSLRVRYPYVEGFTQFETLRHDVEVVTLETVFGNGKVAAFAGALCSHGDMDASLAGTPETDEGEPLLSIKWNTPEDEFNGFTKYLRYLMDTDKKLKENDVCIVVPNRRWMNAAVDVLGKRGFKVNTTGATVGLSGDPRDSKRSRALLAYTKLNLLADRTDIVAWRSWCGFDNYLTNSDAWRSLQDWAEENGYTLLQALEKVSDASQEPFLRAGVLGDAWKSGQEFLAAGIGSKGFGLLRAIGAEGLPEFETLSQTIDGDEDAATLFALQSAIVADPQFPDDRSSLRIVSPENMAGIEARTMFVIGAIDGFVPPRDCFEVISMEEDRVALMDAQRRVFYTAVSKATNLVFSGFSSADLELAETTKMQVLRVRSTDGRRVASLRACSFFEEAGDACPGTMGGQQLLSEHGLA